MKSLSRRVFGSLAAGIVLLALSACTTMPTLQGCPYDARCPHKIMCCKGEKCCKENCKECCCCCFSDGKMQGCPYDAKAHKK